MEIVSCTINEFAEKIGKSYRTVYRAIDKGKVDVVGDPARVDLTSKNTEAYAASHGYKIKLSDFGAIASKPKKPKSTAGRVASPTLKNQLKEDFEGQSFAGKFGLPKDAPDIVALTYLETYEKVRKMRVDTDIKLGKLIAREIVQRMMDQIDSALVKIIMDGAQTLVARIHSKALAGETKEDVQLYYRNEIGKYIKPVKPALKRIIKQAKEEHAEK